MVDMSLLSMAIVSYLYIFIITIKGQHNLYLINNEQIAYITH